jgi:putative salt-induced outer membrane protein
MTRIVYAICTLFFLLSGLGSMILADKVALVNGDVLTGEITKLDKGVLHLTYHKQKLELPWEEISAIESAENVHLLLEDGQTLVGVLKISAAGSEVATSSAGLVALRKEAITSIRSSAEETAYQAQIARLRNPGLIDLWSGFIDTGLATTQGNAESTTVNVSFSAARTSPRDKISVFLTSLYARSDASGVALTTANAIRGGFRYNVNVNERLFSFGFTEMDYDEFQGLDLRFVPGGGFGYRWLRTDRTRFEFFGGGSLNREFYQGDISRTSGELVLGEEIFRQLFTGMHLEHKLTFYPNMSDTGEYRINLDNALVTRLARWISLQLTLSNRLNSNPITGKEKNDLLFTTGLRFNFE